EYDQGDDAEVGMPVHEDHGASNELRDLADPECHLGHRRLELGQARYVIVDVELLKVADANDQKKSDDEKPAHSVEHRCVVWIKSVHFSLPSGTWCWARTARVAETPSAARS